jgi:hypothetical protein
MSSDGGVRYPCLRFLEGSILITHESETGLLRCNLLDDIGIGVPFNPCFVRL